MVAMATFDLQGHRGARGLKPENTLPGFEVALDLGVTSIETDVHLTADGVPVLIHDPVLPDGTLVARLTLSQLRQRRVGLHPDRARFPQQDASVTPLARLFAEHHEIDPYAPPTVTDLFALTVAYAGDLGTQAGKSAAQRERAHRAIIDLELKRVPYRAHNIGDTFDGANPGRLELALVDMIRAAGMVQRTRVRSFDHRCVRVLRRLEPGLGAGVLVSDTAPVDPVALVKQAEATWYFPDYEFVDEVQVRQCHAAGIRVLPWTVNAEADWAQLRAWGVDGITTDYPDHLAAWLRAEGVTF
jgi:glycerophosphoryl diester phosphodiesterase